VAGIDRGKISRSMWLRSEDVVRESLDSFSPGRLYVVPDWRYRWFVHLYPKLPMSLRLWLAARAPHKKE